MNDDNRISPPASTPIHKAPLPNPICALTPKDQAPGVAQRAMPGKDQIQHLKKGKNVLAVYANDQYAPDSPQRYAAIDVRIEGITKMDQRKLDLALEEVLSPKDREALIGASNGGYHYFDSAKIFARMGKAFADALLPLQK